MLVFAVFNLYVKAHNEILIVKLNKIMNMQLHYTCKVRIKKQEGVVLETYELVISGRNVISSKTNERNDDLSISKTKMINGFCCIVLSVLVFCVGAGYLERCKILLKMHI